VEPFRAHAIRQNQLMLRAFPGANEAVGEAQGNICD